MDGTVAMLGGGKIGEALLSGLLRGERTPGDIVVAEKHAERPRYLARHLRRPVTRAPRRGGRGADVLLAVKPQDIDALLAEIARRGRPRHLVVSVAAGITTARIERRWPMACRSCAACPTRPRSWTRR